MKSDKTTKKNYYPDETLFVTFYSFKGGVGRSLALANAGLLLAAAGRKTLIIDADLEAPGLCDILDFNKKKQPGMVEFITALKDWFPAPPLYSGQLSLEILPDNQKKQPAPPDPKDYIAKLPLKKMCDDPKPGGRLHFMPAGKIDEQYATRVEKLGIRYLYKEGRGLAIFKSFKKLIQKLKYDYVLVDARTGFSDIGLVCTYDIADAFVFLCGLNKQNLTGTREMIRSIEESSDAAGGFRPKILVASPVPEAEERLKQERLSLFEKTLGEKPDIILPYHPRMAFIEELFSKEYPESSLTQKYNKLTEMIREFSGDSFDRWLKQFWKYRREKNYKERLFALKMAADADKSAGVQLIRNVTTAIDLERINKNDLAYFELYESLVPNSSVCKQSYGIALDNLGKITKEKKYFEQAIEKFKKAISLKDDDPYFYSDYGGALVELGKLTKEKKHFEQAIEKFKKAISTKDDAPDFYSNYGGALTELGKNTKNKKYFVQAIEKFKKAISLKDDDLYFYYNYGTALTELGKNTKNKKYFVQAIGKFKKAISLKDDDPNFYSNYGTALMYLGRITKEKKYFEQAIEKFRKAISLKADNPNFYSNYGIALTYLGKITKDKKYFEQAYILFKKVLFLDKDLGAYNIACLESLRGRREASLKWLKKAVSIDRVNAGKALEDEDFESLRKDPEFRRICKERPSNKKKSTRKKK